MRSKWVMLCPMARSGSSHTSELLDAQDGVRSHHGLFNEGPFGRWPADQFVAPDKRDYYSSILDESYARIGGQEHTGEFLSEFIFTEDARYNPAGWECIGFKIQFVHLVHMPDLLAYLSRNHDIKIIVNTRRHLLEHAAAELWCQSGNSRAGRPGEAYEFGQRSAISADAQRVRAMFRNLCRYRQFAIETFDDGREFFEWSYEDMFRADGSIDTANHQKLFDFLEIEPSRPFEAPFSRTPRPAARDYFTNYDEIESFMIHTDGGVFRKYFTPEYDPRRDTTWPVLDDYRLGRVMVETDNEQFRRTG